MPDYQPPQRPKLATDDRDVRWGSFGPMRSAFFEAPTPTVEFKPGMSSVDLTRGSAPTPRGDTGRSPSQPTLTVRRLSERAVLPAYQTEGSAGLDVAACLGDGQSIRLAPGQIALVPTGLAMAIPAGFEGQVRPRSGLATKHGVTVANAPGTIDSDYRGELKVALANLGRSEFVVEHGMRVAQLVIAPVARVDVVETHALDETARGHGGFGSTGV